MKKKFLVFVVAAGLFFQSCASVINFMDPAGPEYKGSYAIAPLQDSTDIRVVSYNIAWAKEVDAAINEMQQFESLHQADIILLQEMDIAGVDRMAKTLGYNYIYYPGSIHNVNDKDIGNAILSTWKLSDGKKIILPHKQSWNDRIRTATVATATVRGKRIRIYNVHTATVMMSEDKQLEQLESVLADVTDEYDHVIIGGDFNTARPGSINRVETMFANLGFFYASQDAGFTSRAFGLIPMTLDHIFTKGLTETSCGVVRDAEASDHLPLWTRLRFREAKPQLTDTALVR